MKQRIITTTLIVVSIVTLWGCQRASAQRLMQMGDGRLVIDCSKESGMPQNAVTTEQKYVKVKLSPSNTAFIDESVDGALSRQENEKVYYKFEIDKDDNPADPPTLDWVSAFKYCMDKNNSTEGSGWRLPTSRELLLVYLFRDKIRELAIGGARLKPFEAEYYFTATEDIYGTNVLPARAQTINFAGIATKTSPIAGLTKQDRTGTALRVKARCIREW